VASRGLPLLSLAALGVALGAQKIRSFDYWWQLRTGAWIAETGSVPREDVFTYSVPGEPYLDIHWLHQLGLHALFQAGGHAGVVVGKIVLVLLLTLVVGAIGWRRGRAWVTAAGVGLMLVVAGDRLMPRPELPSFVLLGAILWLLDRDQRRQDAWLFAIVPLVALWANLHGLFALGVAVCGIALAAEIVRPWVVPATSLRVRRVGRFAALTGATALATLCNPNLLDGALYPLQQFGMIGPEETRGLFGSLIQELLPTIGGSQALPPLLATLALGLAGASLLAMSLNWRRLEALDPLLWVAFGYLALSAQRNLALFGIVAAALWARNLNAYLDRRPPRPRRGALAAAVVTLALAWVSVDVASSRFFSRTGSFREAGFGPLELLYPIGAAEWLARERPPGRIAHQMADGGYLIWRLWPEYEVLVDGRLEIYGEERFAELQIFEPERFRELDARYGFGSVLLHYSLFDVSELLWWFHLNSAWRLVYVDEAGALFVRVTPETRHHAEIDLDAPGLFPPLPGGTAAGDRMRRLARTTFLMALRRPEAALALWEESLELHPDLPRGPLVRATLLAQLGRREEASRVVEQLLLESPEDAAFLVQLADLESERDRDAARSLYDRALEIAPDFAYGLLRRGVVAELDGQRDLALQHYGRALALAPASDPVAIQARAGLGRLGFVFEAATERP
jgi:tetratricopeptide (TPR) repeat protein